MDEYENNNGFFAGDEADEAEKAQTAAPQSAEDTAAVNEQPQPVEGAAASEQPRQPENAQPRPEQASAPNQPHYRQYGGYAQQSYSGGYAQRGQYTQQGGYTQNNQYSAGSYGAGQRQYPGGQNGYYSSQNGAYGGYQQPSRPQQYTPSPVTPAPQRNDKTGKKIFLALVAVVLICAIIGTVMFLREGNSASSEKPRTTVTQKADGNSADNGGNVKIPVAAAPESEDVLTAIEVAKKGRASCVGIIVYVNGNSSSEAGQGTGILAMEDETKTYTYVLTCAHVISKGGVKVKVQLEDGTSYDAEIVAYDTRTDVGVLRIKASGLSIAEFGDSSALSVGSSVYAVGNPGGIEFFGSVTDGIVSAIDRPIDSEIGYTMTCIQHTAAINPGNSGGALLNAYGQVIGINSQKIAATEYEGMSFSIPINSALEIAEDLINYKYVPDRAKLGITYYSLNASMQYSIIAQANKLPSGTLIINTIDADSDLANTQAQQYDMIVAVNGEDMTTPDVLLEKIDNGRVGDKLVLSICRANSDYSLQSFEVTVLLIEDKGSSVPSTTTTTVFNPFDNYGFGF